MEFELAEMRALVPEFVLRQDQGKSYWHGRAGNYDVKIVYPAGYPTSPLEVYASPKMNTHHHGADGKLCLWRSHEWSPDYTAATVVGIIVRYINEYLAGRISS
jgi:ubiquitin-protein ligase